MNTNALLKLQREQQKQIERDDIFTIYIISTKSPNEEEEEEGLKKYEQHQSPTTEYLSPKLQYPNREPVPDPSSSMAAPLSFIGSLWLREIAR